MDYNIKLTEKQITVVKNALEEYFRLRMGQRFDFADSLAEMESDYKNLDIDSAERKAAFSRFLWQRDVIEDHMKSVFRTAFGNDFGVPNAKTNDMMIAECIWDAIRVALGQSNYGKVLPIGSEPIPEIAETSQIVKTGVWIKKHDDVCYWHECSECGNKPLANEWNKTPVLSEYCPHCGARMEPTSEEDF